MRPGPQPDKVGQPRNYVLLALVWFGNNWGSNQHTHVANVNQPGPPLECTKLGRCNSPHVISYQTPCVFLFLCWTCNLSWWMCMSFHVMILFCIGIGAFMLCDQ